ncbi:hypothetical protein [Pseudomonas sp. NFACC42-2]|jgi:hypothetical protein|uniref:hypothetical protein n=1 Tax=Pseudomonas sp. NFACC42-2 TaxID=1566193 RepID=UPI0008E339C5|nr:hypothetical protein [Pseudomonas sp. NFACC42-2]SFS29034.1 hypothetical protein SAMN03159318_05361 [Pseudomonas sp. NFACC42-2]
MSFSSIGCRIAQWLCLLLMCVSAIAFILAWAYLDRDSSWLGTAAAGFVWGGIGLLFACVFERSRTAAATLRFMLTWTSALLVFAAGVAYLVGLLWVGPEQDFMDAQLKGASCGKYTGTIEKGWEQICARSHSEPPQTP